MLASSESGIRIKLSRRLTNEQLTWTRASQKPDLYTYFLKQTGTRVVAYPSTIDSFLRGIAFPFD
uniref:Uncharacterized protein n=1 Tax=Utricularia reniformis TaxID=192314 RepID=A0A1Y0B271_9LAMI|nr:hypothetical protein AEK19_MT1284 [Utricularia reniformis]ART31488.1 hypothetical protein AEK19_MT1284 [Utricularia reniformis]